MTGKTALLVYTFVFTLFCVLYFVFVPVGAENSVVASMFLVALFIATAALKEEK